jgi:hypothetical protein
MGIDEGGDKGSGAMIVNRNILGRRRLFPVFAGFPDFTGLDQNIAVADDSPRIFHNPPGPVNAVAAF